MGGSNADHELWYTPLNELKALRWAGPMLIATTTVWAAKQRDPTKFHFPNWELGGLLFGVYGALVLAHAFAHECAVGCLVVT
jgi:hypothetical protein